jgi:hypothetical protein
VYAVNLLTILWSTNYLFLVGLISVLKPNLPPQQVIQQETIASSSSEEAPAPAQVDTKQKKPKPTLPQLAAETDFDLSLARLSFMIDIFSHSLVSLSSTDPNGAAQAAFVGFTLLSSLGSGVVPSMQSLALCILQGDELEREGTDGAQAQSLTTSTGALFGALSVLQAVGQMIIGVSFLPSFTICTRLTMSRLIQPMLFGLVYSLTVADFPKAIFTVAAACLLIALAFLALVRPPIVIAESRWRRMFLRRRRLSWRSAERMAHSGVERGRSKVRKDLSGSVMPSNRVPYTGGRPGHPRGT